MLADFPCVVFSFVHWLETSSLTQHGMDQRTSRQGLDGPVLTAMAAYVNWTLKTERHSVEHFIVMNSFIPENSPMR